MTSRQRALLGAALGAIGVLIAHPATRPGMLAAWRPQPKAGLEGLLARPKLSAPKDATTGAAYIHAGADRLATGPSLKPAERQSLLAITTEGQRAEPENAFWPLARYVFLGGMNAEAIRAWSVAARCKTYNDHQSKILTDDVNRVAGHVGDVQAWIYASASPQRSESLATAIVSQARRMLRTRRTLNIRFDTVKNGAMIRDGSRRLNLGQYGIELIERATFPAELAATASPRRIWIAKTKLTGELRAQGRAADARFCDHQFRINDSWLAFTQTEDPVGRFRAFAVIATIVATLPGALLLGAVFGLGIYLFGRRVDHLAEHRSRFRGPGLTACSLLLLGLGTWLGFPFAALAAGACALVPALSPERPRGYDKRALGPLFIFCVSTLTFILLLAIAMSAVSRSLPGTILPQQGSVGAWLAEDRRWNAVVVMTLGASALIGPAWAIVRRFSTPSMSAQTYLTMGRSAIVTGLALAIVASPLSLALDRWAGENLGRIVLNEQVYYNPKDPSGT